MSDIVKQAFDYYDSNNHIYKVKHANFFEIISNQYDTQHNIIVFYDKNKQEIYRSRFEIMGSYFNDTNTWIWGWAIPFLRKNTQRIIKNVLNYIIDMDLSEVDLIFKTELMTSRTRISNMIQIEKYGAISSYLSKNPMTYHIDISNDLDKPNDIYDSGMHPIIGKMPRDKFIRFYIFLLDYERFDTRVG